MSTFKFAEQFEFEPFFEDDEVFSGEQRKVRTAAVDFNDLVKKLNTSNFIYNPDQILRRAITTLNLSSGLTEYLLGKSDNKPNPNWFISKTSRIAFKHQEREFFYDAFLSTEKGKTVRKEKAEFNFNINLEETLFKYRVLFPFNSFKPQANINQKYAIIIESDNYDELEVLLNAIGINFHDNIKNKILAEFNKEFNKAGDDRNELDKIYQYAPRFVIKSRKRSTLIKDLKNILRGFVDEEFTNEEVAVLNILSALNSKLRDEKSKIDANTEFLRILITEKIGNSSITLFQKLYEKLDDRGGEDNFSTFIYLMYAFWRESNYAKQDLYEDNESVGPSSLPYQNKQIFGFYKNGFDFTFLPYRKEPHIFVKKGHDEIIGTYHLFQPIQLPEVDQKSKSLILYDTYAPAFYLKAFDDKAAWDNFEKGVWTSVELVTTLVGVGNVLKFRHLLRKAASQAIELKLALGTIEVTSGSLGTMLNFVNDCSPSLEKNKKGKKTFCQNLKDFLILLDIATLSINGIDELLRIQAKRTQDAGRDLLKRTRGDVNGSQQINKIIDDLDEVSGVLQESMEILKKNPAYNKALEFIEKYKIFLEFMTPEKAAMIRLYTGGTYIKLNQALRGLGAKLDEDFLAMQKVLDNALSKLPSYNNSVIKRAAYFSESDINKLFKEGDNFKEKGFLSATYSEEALDAWLIDNKTHNTIFNIQGKNAKLVEEASMLPHEAELLFKSGTDFEVLNVGKTYNFKTSKEYFVITLKEI